MKTCTKYKQWRTNSVKSKCNPAQLDPGIDKSSTIRPKNDGTCFANLKGQEQRFVL
jgi:hypothetical protein